MWDEELESYGVYYIIENEFSKPPICWC